jgi:hypothetical protein
MTTQTYQLFAQFAQFALFVLVHAFVHTAACQRFAQYVRGGMQTAQTARGRKFAQAQAQRQTAPTAQTACCLRVGIGGTGRRGSNCPKGGANG